MPELNSIRSKRGFTPHGGMSIVTLACVLVLSLGLVAWREAYDYSQKASNHGLAGSTGQGLASCIPGASVQPAAVALPQEEPPNRYMGATVCRNCHRAEEKGNAFGQWERSRHAHALESLASDRARELAAARNVENPVEAAECRRCHATGVGAPAEQLHPRFPRDLGIQCESCHGPGERHVRARMAAARDPQPVPFGGLANEIQMGNEEGCRGCHNDQSPSFQEFNYRERLRVIRHRDPTREGHPPEPEEEGGN